MFEETGLEPLPPIVVCEADYDKLSDMAAAARGRSPAAASQLLHELERADVVPAEAFPSRAVRVGSTVDYRWDGGSTRRATLVLPAEADISDGRVSVLTPVGTALLGLSQGQSIAFRAHNGASHRLTILRVDPPAGGTV